MDKFVCIGDHSHWLFKFLNFEGCGEQWDFEPTDGKCPICRGFLVPKFLMKPRTQFLVLLHPKEIDETSVPQSEIVWCDTKLEAEEIVESHPYSSHVIEYKNAEYYEGEEIDNG